MSEINIRGKPSNDAEIDLIKNLDQVLGSGICQFASDGKSEVFIKEEPFDVTEVSKVEQVRSHVSGLKKNQVDKRKWCTGEVMKISESSDHLNCSSPNEGHSSTEVGACIKASDQLASIASAKECDCDPTLRKNTDEIKNILYKVQESVERLDKQFDELNRRTQDNSLKLDKLCRNNHIHESSNARINFTAARTPEELDDLASHSDIVPYLLHAADSTLNRTIANMARMLMSRELAIRFSLTGLGNKRTKTKLEFRRTAAYKVIERALYQLDDFKATTRKEFQTAIGVVLKNAGDWHGQRNKRVPRRFGPNSEFLQSHGVPAQTSSQNENVIYFEVKNDDVF